MHVKSAQKAIEKGREKSSTGHTLEVHILQVGTLQGCAGEVGLREVGASQISLRAAFRTSFPPQMASNRCTFECERGPYRSDIP